MPILLAIRFSRYFFLWVSQFQRTGSNFETFNFLNFLDYCVKSKLIVLNIHYFRFSQFHTTTNTLKKISTHYQNISIDSCVWVSALNCAGGSPVISVTAVNVSSWITSSLTGAASLQAFPKDQYLVLRFSDFTC